MVFIALGANLPRADGTKPHQTLKDAVLRLSEKNIIITGASRIWRSQAIPKNDIHPDFFNAVIQVRTSLSPADLMALLHDTEVAFGRVRSEKNEPRMLDLDIISFDDFVIRDGDLQIPHPRMHERAFVLFPLREIDGAWTHPVSREKIDKLIESLPKDQILEPMDEKVA